MMPAAFSEILHGAGLGFASQYDSHRNLVRHTIASWLHRRVEERLIDEFLGHEHVGLELCGAWSSAARPAFATLERELDLLLEKVFGRVLDVRI